MPNIYAVHFDPIMWPEPEVFNPSRHLTEEGKINKRDELIPFSVGELFEFFTTNTCKCNRIFCDSVENSDSSFNEKLE